jgi:superoxide dismutase, Cu-Zn family
MRTPFLAVTAAFLLSACGGRDTAPAADSLRTGNATTDGDRLAGGTAESVTMRDAAGRELGTLTVTEGGDGITVEGTLRGLAPGERGIHIHTVGRCEAPGFSSAGGHWNPDSTRHGTENPQGPHRGDLLNITVGTDSSVAVRQTTRAGRLRGADGLLDTDGAAVVVHARADDYRTDPAGNAGDRVACGVIGESRAP